MFVHALTSQLDNVNQAFRNGGILLRILPLGRGLIIALVPVGKLLRQDGRQLQITETQLLILFFLRVVLYVVPHVPFGALLRVELLEFQTVLVYSLGLEDFYFFFQLFELVWVWVEEVAVEKGWWVVDFWRGANELWVYAVQLVHCLLLLERSVECFEFLAIVWRVALIVSLSKSLVGCLLITVYLCVSFLLVARFGQWGLFVPMKRTFSPILLPLLKPKNHLVKLFKLHLITLKILNISIGLVFSQHHEWRTLTRYIDSLWRLQLSLELTIKVPFGHVLGGYGSAGFGQFQ